LRRRFAIPAKDRVRPGDRGDVGQSLAAQAMTDLAQHASLGVRQFQSTFQLRLEDAVLGGQILVPPQQLLVHRPRHVGRMRAQSITAPLPRPSTTASRAVREIVPDRLRHC
jgi:hypothetical protein